MNQTKICHIVLYRRVRSRPSHDTFHVVRNSHAPPASKAVDQQHHTIGCHVCFFSPSSSQNGAVGELPSLVVSKMFGTDHCAGPEINSDSQLLENRDTVVRKQPFTAITHWEASLNGFCSACQKLNACDSLEKFGQKLTLSKKTSQKLMRCFLASPGLR